MNKVKKSLIFSAPHKTTFSNISPIIDSINHSFDLIYLCQCNYYKESEKMCEYIIKNYNIEAICLKNPFKFNNYYNPIFLHRLFIKLYVKIFLRKKLMLSNYYIFCPGGLLEGTIAKLFYKKRKKTIMIEGGFPLDLLIVKRNKIYQNLFSKYFKNHPINKPLKYVNYLLVSGNYSKKIRVQKGFEENKILDFGVPRNIKLFSVKQNNDIKRFDIIFLTGSFYFHEDYYNYKKQKLYIEKLIKFVQDNNLKLLLQIHPRDKEEYSFLNNSQNITIAKDNLFENIQNSKVCLSFYSTSIYESLILNTLAYFIGEKISGEWPEDELILKHDLLLKKINYSVSQYDEELNNNKLLAFNHINKNTERCLDLLIGKILDL